jgi:hypothetical protein
MKLPLSLSLWLVSSAAAFSPVSKNIALHTAPDSSTRLFYDAQSDPPNENVWSVLASTERWIKTTLDDAQQGGNPLSRKEVSYVCETSPDPAMILANIFRKLKEARQLGESHAQQQEERLEEEGKKPEGTE